MKLHSMLISCVSNRSCTFQVFTLGTLATAAKLKNMVKNCSGRICRKLDALLVPYYIAEFTKQVINLPLDWITACFCFFQHVTMSLHSPCVIPIITKASEYEKRFTNKGGMGEFILDWAVRNTRGQVLHGQTSFLIPALTILPNTPGRMVRLEWEGSKRPTLLGNWVSSRVRH